MFAEWGEDAHVWWRGRNTKVSCWWPVLCYRKRFVWKAGWKDEHRIGDSHAEAWIRYLENTNDKHNHLAMPWISFVCCVTGMCLVRGKVKIASLHTVKADGDLGVYLGRSMDECAPTWVSTTDAVWWSSATVPQVLRGFFRLFKGFFFHDRWPAICAWGVRELGRFRLV